MQLIWVFDGQGNGQVTGESARRGRWERLKEYGARVLRLLFLFYVGGAALSALLMLLSALVVHRGSVKAMLLGQMVRCFPDMRPYFVVAATLPIALTLAIARSSRGVAVGSAVVLPVMSLVAWYVGFVAEQSRWSRPHVPFSWALLAAGLRSPEVHWWAAEVLPPLLFGTGVALLDALQSIAVQKVRGGMRA